MDYAYTISGARGEGMLYKRAGNWFSNPQPQCALSLCDYTNGLNKIVKYDYIYMYDNLIVKKRKSASRSELDIRRENVLCE